MKVPLIGWTVLSLVVAGAFALFEAAQADPASTPAIDWAAVTADDLNAIHDLRRDNSPATVVERDSAHFRLWLEEGLQKCRQGVRDAPWSVCYETVDACHARLEPRA